MSTALQQRSWSAAMADAEAFRSLFPAETYHRWELAGSLRRRRPQVGDVEHVVIPRIGELASDDLFATPRQVNLVFFHFDTLCAACMRRVPKELRSRLLGNTNLLCPTHAEAVLEAIEFIRAKPKAGARRQRPKEVVA